MLNIKLCVCHLPYYTNLFHRNHKIIEGRYAILVSNPWINFALVNVETNAPSAHALVRDMHTGRAHSGYIQVKTIYYKKYVYLLGGFRRQGL